MESGWLSVHGGDDASTLTRGGVVRLGSVPAFSPLEWPVFRQLRSGDVFGRGPAVTSAKTRAIEPRTATADRVVQSVCPFCAVGCGQKVYVKDERVVQIEGDPDSPPSRADGCAPPRARRANNSSTTRCARPRFVTGPPYATEWQDLDRDTAIDMIADRFLEARRRGWQDHDDEGRPLRRTMGIASLGGATLDNEENYLIKKLFTAAGAIQIENQARI